MTPAVIMQLSQNCRDAHPHQTTTSMSRFSTEYFGKQCIYKIMVTTDGNIFEILNLLENKSMKIRIQTLLLEVAQKKDVSSLGQSVDVHSPFRLNGDAATSVYNLNG
jgi:hypothetical protein